MSVSSGLSSAPQLPLTPNGEQAAAASSAEHRNGLGGASFGGGGGSRRHHSRMLSVDSLAEISKPQKVVPMVRHVFSEGFLLFRLAIILYSYLGMGWKWSVQFTRLVIYAMLLMPGFIQMIYYYYFSPRVNRSVVYGHQPRQRLDLYTPEGADDSQPFPVVIYITGGAWTIGYKAWGALLARRLCAQGVLVACLDYRNFPQGHALQMLEDVNTGISWVTRKIDRYGGDPDNIVLVGQSAGGQLAALAMIRQAEQAVTERAVSGASPAWSPRDVRAFVGVSGAYDLEALAEHLHRRGLYKGLFEQLMSLDGHVAYARLSPVAAARNLEPSAAQLVPEVLLIHGDNDKSVPFASSVDLDAALQAAGVVSSCRVFSGKTHTSFLLEDPMCGGRDLLTDTILSVVTRTPHSHDYPMLCPWVLCRLGGWICPF